MTTEDFEFEPELENDGDGTTPDFDAMDDKTFAAFLEGRDSTPSDSLQDLTDQSDDADQSTGEGPIGRVRTGRRGWATAPTTSTGGSLRPGAEPDTDPERRCGSTNSQTSCSTSSAGWVAATAPGRTAERYARPACCTWWPRSSGHEDHQAPRSRPRAGERTAGRTAAGTGIRVRSGRTSPPQRLPDREDRAAGRGREPAGTAGTDQADTGVLGLPNDHSATISRSADAMGLRSAATLTPWSGSWKSNSS